MGRERLRPGNPVPFSACAVEKFDRELSAAPRSFTNEAMNKIVGSTLQGATLGEESAVGLDLPELAPRRRLKVTSLFAGIGGFDHAFEMADAEVVFQCEVDGFCRSVLRRHWPDAKLADDIRTLMPDIIPESDVWTAGFPCQDVSLARGNHGRSGLKGNHTSLFFKLMGLVDVRRPRVLVLENVVGLLNSHQGRDFAIILRELTSRGYAVSWRVLNARYFGAPQSRSRVFLCAWLGDYQRAVTALFQTAPGEKPGRQRVGFLTQHVHPSTGAIVPEVAYCVAATSGRHTGNDWARSYISYRNRIRRPTPTESERLQGFPAGWSLPEEGYRAPARGLDSERYKAVGNAVAVPVVRWVADRIARLASKPPSRALKMNFHADVMRAAPDLRKDAGLLHTHAVMAAVDREEFVHRWKAGGCAWDDQIVEGAASVAPLQIIPSRFVDALDPDVPDDRYFLTANAAVGILRRADIVGRTLFPPMRLALENLVSGKAANHPAEMTIKTVGDTGVRTRLRTSRAIKRRKIERAGSGTGW